jgi:hypothetical protein
VATKSGCSARFWLALRVGAEDATGLALLGGGSAERLELGEVATLIGLGSRLAASGASELGE